MRISAVRAYRQVQPFREGAYGTAAGTATAFDSLVVALESDQGLVGWGEMAPLGSFYSEAFAAGARAGVDELAPALLGRMLSHPRRLSELLDQRLRGHRYIKSAFDMAAWDLHAQRAGQSLCDALGGRCSDTVRLYHPIASADAATMASQARRYVDAGYTRLQVKVGREPTEDAERVTAVREAVGSGVVMYADANGAWTTQAALQFLHAVGSNIEITLEQPCATLDECLAVRRRCPHPLVLDESIDSLGALLHAARTRVCDGITLKLARLGGVTHTALLRDVASGLNLPITIEDTGGGSINTAAVLHLNASTPQRLHVHATALHLWISGDNATGLAEPREGALAVPTTPGLGIAVDQAALGAPIFRVTSPRPGR